MMSLLKSIEGLVNFIRFLLKHSWCFKIPHGLVLNCKKPVMGVGFTLWVVVKISLLGFIDIENHELDTMIMSNA